MVQFLFTIPGPLIQDDIPPTGTSVLETWYDDSLDAEDGKSFHQIYATQIPESGLIHIGDEFLLETPTPSPEDIDRLEADVIAMLKLNPGNPAAQGPPAHESSAGKPQTATLKAVTFLLPDTTSKPLPPLPTERLSESDPRQEPEIIEPPHYNGRKRPDSGIVLDQSPRTQPHSPRWNTSRAPHQPITHRPSRIDLDAEDLAGIEDFSRSLDFGDRPILSLSAYAHIWPETHKEPPLKRLLDKVNDGNKRMLRGARNAGPRVFRSRRRKSGEARGRHEKTGDGSRERRNST